MIPIKKVWIYRNLSSKYRREADKTYSIRRPNGKLIGHVRNLILKDVKFVVWAGKRERVLRKRRRNVHAFACGEVIATEPRTTGWEEVTYDPFKRADFFRRQTGEAVHRADFALVTPRGVFIPA